MAVYHVRPRDDGKWEVKKRGNERATETGSKAAMLSAVRSYLEPGDTKVIHNDDGSVLRRDKVSQADAKQQQRQARDLSRSVGNSPFQW